MNEKGLYYYETTNKQTNESYTKRKAVNCIVATKIISCDMAKKCLYWLETLCCTARAKSYCCGQS